MVSEGTVRVNDNQDRPETKRVHDSMTRLFPEYAGFVREHRLREFTEGVCPYCKYKGHTSDALFYTL